MKKIIALAATTAVVGLTAFGQSKFNGQATLLIDNFKNQVAIAPADTSEQTVSVLAVLSDGADTERIEALGAQVEEFANNVYGVEIPVSKLEALGDLLEVQYVEYTEPKQVMLDYARPSGKVDVAHSGFEYDGAMHSFTGAGVATGLMDTGVDPNHINFKTADGALRVNAVYFFTGQSGTATKMAIMPSAIARLTTDDANATHGTHVCGIMAGSYNGEGQYAYVASSSGSRVQLKDGDIPYYGVATGSDIIMCGGLLYNANILGAIKNMVQRAETINEPLVINLSLGGNDGAHDGTDALTRGLEGYTDQAIIVVSAGNEGDSPFYITKTFTDTDKEVKTFVTNNNASGTVEIWGRDDTPFKVTIGLYANAGGEVTEVCSVSAPGQSGTSTGNTLYNSNYNGAVSIVSSVNNLNKRYNVTCSMSASQKKSGYNLAIIVEGNAGQTIYMWGNEQTTFTANKVSGWTNGSCDGTINSMACGKDIISIGAYTTRTTWGTLSGALYKYTDSAFKVNSIAPFSSWGQNFAGEWLPTVCAPGANIVSSYNTAYVANHGGADSMSASASDAKGTYYWSTMQGTSMSSPFAAGVIALWLEADPTLGAADVINIIKETSEPVNTIPGIGLGGGSKDEGRWGAGKIDAVAGLKYVLDRSGVGVVIADDKGVIVTPISRGVFEVFAAGEPAVRATLVSLNGVEVASAKGDNNTVTLDASSVAQGVYVLRVDGRNSSVAKKVVIK